MKLHPLLQAYYDDYMLSGTDTPVQEVILDFNEWMQRRVWRNMPLKVTKLSEESQAKFLLLSELGYSIDRITGTFCLPRSKTIYRAFSDDLNDVVFTLCLLPCRYIPYVFCNGHDDM